MNNLPKEVRIIKPFHAGYKLFHVGDKLPVKIDYENQFLDVKLTDTMIMSLNEMMTLGFIEKTELYRNEELITRLLLNKY